jgi:hypothetical protein
MQSKIIHGLRKHKTRPTCFILVVDNFAIKYTYEQDAEHLISMLKQDYNITIDWEATKYIGLTIEWDFKKNQVHTYMPGYLDKALICFKHKAPIKKQNSPHPYICPNYGPKEQYAKVGIFLTPMLCCFPSQATCWYKFRVYNR